MKTMRDCINFANQNPYCCLASVDGDRPRVRLMKLLTANLTGFYFQSISAKEVIRQIHVNPNIEACFYKKTDSRLVGWMLRVAGKAELLRDKELEKKTLKERPILSYLGLSFEKSDLILFRIPHGEAFFWNMETKSVTDNILNF